MSTLLTDKSVEHSGYNFRVKQKCPASLSLNLLLGML